jgi:type IV pilus biogenesis protein CpaD/CtpE
MMLEVVFPEETSSDLEQQHLHKVWLAGLGSIDGIVHNTATRTSNAHAAPARSASSETQTSVMLCAWREDSCLYTTDHPNYDMYGCVYNQDPTAQHEIHTPSTRYQKLLRNGQLFILHNQKIYNIIGIEIK